MGKLKNLNPITRSNIITYVMVVILYAVMQALLSAKVISSSTAGLLVPITAYICLSISLNLVVGISGELSLGHAGFMSVGAFTGVIVASMLAGSISVGWVRLLVSMLVGGAFAGLAGFVVGVPVMRLHGDYLAIVTLAFGEIIKNLLNNLYAGFDASGLHLSMTSAQALGMEGGKIVINGPQGAVGITKLSNFTMGFLLMLFTLFVVLNLINSRTGRAIMAVRDNRIAAESVGINTTKYRLIAFVVSAALAGMAGALYAQNFSSIVPKKFSHLGLCGARWHGQHPWRHHRRHRAHDSAREVALHRRLPHAHVCDRAHCRHAHHKQSCHPVEDCRHTGAIATSRRRQSRTGHRC